MTQRDRLQATFKEANWDEKAVLERDGIKLTRTRYEATYQGDLEGQSVIESIMTYRPDGTVSYVGVEQFQGKVRGEAGSFVVHSSGEYKDGVASSTGELVSGAGTGAGAELRGRVDQRATKEGPQSTVIELTR